MFADVFDRDEIRRIIRSTSRSSTGTTTAATADVFAPESRQPLPPPPTVISIGGPPEPPPGFPRPLAPAPDVFAPQAGFPEQFFTGAGGTGAGGTPTPTPQTSPERALPPPPTLTPTRLPGVPVPIQPTAPTSPLLEDILNSLRSRPLAPPVSAFGPRLPVTLTPSEREFVNVRGILGEGFPEPTPTTGPSRAPIIDRQQQVSDELNQALISALTTTVDIGGQDLIVDPSRFISTPGGIDIGRVSPSAALGTNIPELGGRLPPTPQTFSIDAFSLGSDNNRSVLVGAMRETISVLRDDERDLSQVDFFDEVFPSYVQLQELANRGFIEKVPAGQFDPDVRVGVPILPPIPTAPTSDVGGQISNSGFADALELNDGSILRKITLNDYASLVNSDPTLVFPMLRSVRNSETGETEYYIVTNGEGEVEPQDPSDPGGGGGGGGPIGGGPGPGGGPAPAVPPIETTGEWSVTYAVDDAPVWWLGKTSSNTTDPNDQLAAELNAVIPFLSPEDQEFMEGLIFQVFPNAFPEYSDIAFGPPPTEITTELRDIFTSADRGRSFAEALNRLAGALNLSETELGPGFIFLRQLADILSQFGGGPPGQGQRQTREMFEQQQTALENLMNAAQGNPALKNLIDAARRLSEPGFTAGPVVPLSRDPQGNLVFGAPNPEFF